MDLAGRVSDRSLTVKGTLRGDRASEVDLVVTGVAVPIDHKLMLALPERSRELARTFCRWGAGSWDYASSLWASWSRPARPISRF